MPDQPSEWGKLNQGQSYTPFAMDVARAVFAVGLGEHQASLFWYFAEHCWAPARKGRTHGVYADPVGCTIKLAEVAKLWGVPLPRLSAARKWLLDAGMILEIGGEIRVNKDASSWRVPGTDTPLLSPEKLAYAVAARTRSRKTDEQLSVTVDRNLEGDQLTVDRNNCMDSVTVNRNNCVDELTVDRNLRQSKGNAPVGAHADAPPEEKRNTNPKDKTPPTPQGGGSSDDGFVLTSPEPTRTRKRRRVERPFVLPDWIPEEMWEAFLEMRQRIRRPATDWAQKLVVKELERLRGMGHDPLECLECSIRNSWQDVWEPKKSPNGTGARDSPARPAAKPDSYFDPQAYLKELAEK